MKYFSMFSGIGGFEYGIQCASYQSTNAVSRQAELDKDMLQVQFGETLSALPRNNSRIRNANQTQRGILSTDNRRKWPVCVGYSEIDKYAIKVYERNFNGHTNYGDATKINPKELPDFDLLVGGFPCQAFSIAGKRKGFDDTRGTLFFDIARILAEKKPKHLVLENVKGLLSHDQGRTFQTILGVLSDLGYRVEWQVLNSKDFGVPQNRERIIIVGHLGGFSGRKVFPITEGNPAHLREITSEVSDAQRIYDLAGLAKTLKGLGGGLGAKTGMYQLENAKIRRLTPTECERLQGFPDDWTKYGVGDELISDTQRYKMCGNAVTTNVIQAVMEKLL
jgi:DNA (cytosine-5)-methyltransferase 1